MTKLELRKTYLKKRSLLAGEELNSQSRVLAYHFFENFNLRIVNTLHTFLPIKKLNEIDTSYIYERIWREFPRIQTIVPRVDSSSGEMEHIAFTVVTEFVENQWGIPEPANGEVIDATEIDLVIVPLLCFDESGYRVGYGKGFYDKFLMKCRPDCLKVGLSNFPPVQNINEIAKYDIPLDFCITPQRIYRS